MLDGLKKSDPIRTNVAITDKIYHMLKMEMCDMVPDVTAWPVSQHVRNVFC